MSDQLIAAWRRVADRQDGPPSLRIDRLALLGLVDAAERVCAELDEARAVARRARYVQRRPQRLRAADEGLGMSAALPADIAIKLALATRLTDAYVTLTAAELSTWQAWTAAHDPTIAPSLPAGATPTPETHPDSPETSEGHTAPLPPPDVPRCDGCRWWTPPSRPYTYGTCHTAPDYHCASWTPKETP